MIVEFVEVQLFSARQLRAILVIVQEKPTFYVMVNTNVLVNALFMAVQIQAHQIMTQTQQKMTVAVVNQELIVAVQIQAHVILIRRLILTTTHVSI
jgi:hypothetical protein